MQRHIPDDLDGLHQQTDSGAQEHLNRRVHRVRIEVHNLRCGEENERYGWSENHVTCALLLGDGQSVRIDMTPEVMTHNGTMIIQDRNRIVSNKTVRLTDINAVGCQNDFDPDRSPSELGLGRSVGSFTHFLHEQHLDRYRFMYVNSQAMGCRYWV
jgi:hypothetical protein